MSAPLILARSPNSTIARWSNVCVTIVRSQLVMADVDVAKPTYESFAQKSEQGFVSVIVVPPGVGLPSDEVRKVIPTMRKAFEHRVLAMAAIFESTGFAAAAVRSAMAVMWLLARGPYPRKAAASVQEAAPWLLPFVVPTSTTDAVRSAINHVKEM
jgi:hypothetical protein